MGRKKLELTAAEIEERKQRFWGAARNSRRRARYHSDEEYRQAAIQSVRDAYRSRLGGDGKDVCNDDCRTRLASVPDHGSEMLVVCPGRTPFTILAFTVTDLAALLQRNVQVLYRWMKAGIFPYPTLHVVANTPGPVQRVYCREEIEAIMHVFGAHQQLSQYYRNAHTETREGLFQAVKNVRQARQLLSAP